MRQFDIDEIWDAERCKDIIRLLEKALVNRKLLWKFNDRDEMLAEGEAWALDPRFRV